MENKDLIGNINSIQTLGTLDGPGVRFVAFLQGCPLRCSVCHNPETQSFDKEKEYSAKELFEMAKKYVSYFGKDGGVTLSGGEPLMQAKFAREFFALCKKEGINTCLDTSGCILGDDVLDLLKYTDRVLLDIKYTSDDLYKLYVGESISPVLDFLKVLNKLNIPTTIRQVIIKDINDTEENIKELGKIISKYKNIDKIELLPFKKICISKYELLGKTFPFTKKEAPDVNILANLQDMADKIISTH